MDANWPTRVHTHVFPGSALWPCGRNADSSAEALSARQPGVLLRLPFSPLPGRVAQPLAEAKQAKDPLSSLLRRDSGRGTGYTEEEDWKDRAPIRSGLSAQMDPWSLRNERVQSLPAVLEIGWMFVVSGLGQVQND